MNVIIKDTQKGTNTDQNGFYKIELPAGSYTVRCTYIGYNTQEVQIQIEAKKTTEVSFNLVPGTIQSEAIQIIDGKVEAQERTLTTTKSLMVQGGVVQPGNFNTEEYAYIEEGGFRDVSKSPLSTFSIDSFGIEGS